MERQQDLLRHLRMRLYPDFPLCVGTSANGAITLMAAMDPEDVQGWRLVDSRHIVNPDGTMALHVAEVQAGQEVELMAKENIPGQKWVLSPP